MREMTKAQKSHLAELASRAYERELARALGILGEKFQKWQDGEITPLDLHEEIHHYHNGTARDLYKIYEMVNDPRIAVAQAIAKGILAYEEVDERCRPAVERLVAHFRQ
jgi:hypothetical protein